MANGGIQIFEQDGSLIPNPPIGKFVLFLDTDGTWKKKDENGVITPAYDVDTDLNNKVSVSAGDTTNGFLDAKILGTTDKITLTILNPGGDEDLQINIGTDIFDKTVDDTDDITEGLNKFVTATDITNLGNLSGINTGDETTISIQTKRPLKTIEGQSIEGVGNIDLDANDVGLGNVDNTSDLDKPISTATQTALDGKKDDFTENTAFNKDFGTTAGTVLEGNTPTITTGEQTKLGFITVTSAINLDNLIEPFAVDLDSAESSVTRVESGGRTNYTITHNKNTLDLNSEVFRLSDGRTIGWRVERTGVNTVVASRAGSVANGLFRIILK